MSYTTSKLDDKVAALLADGGVGLLPSDTIYGLSALAADQPAVERLYRLKRRGRDKPMVVLVSDLQQLPALGINPYELKAFLKYWPGPITFIVPASQPPQWLDRDTGMLALRMPDQPDLLKLINLIGPIVSTSANLSGELPLQTAKQAQATFGDGLDFYVDKPPADKRASTIIKIKDGQVEVIRQGSLKIDLKEVKRT